MTQSENINELLENSTHLSCHQINNVHICVCKELVAICPQETDPTTGEVIGKTMIIPMPIFAHMTHLVTEDLINATFSGDSKLN